MSNEIVPYVSKAEEDFTTARANILDVIATGSQSMAEVMQLADQSQSPRFYEVLATMMKTMVDANEKLLDIHKKAKDLKNAEVKETGPTTVNNNLILTTEELQDLILHQTKTDE